MADDYDDMPRWYVWLFMHTTKKPYTWITRDSAKNNILVWLLGFACAGWIVGVYFKQHWIPILLGLLAGLYLGHCFWT